MKQPIKKRIAEANNIKAAKNVYTLIVDGNNLLKISLVDKRMNDRGEVYGAVLTFMRKLGVILSRKDFDYCIVCWDGNGSGVLRWKYYEDYKSNRDKHYENHQDNQTDYDKYINNYCKAILRSKKAEEKSNDDILFEKQKYLIQSLLEELCVRQYEYDDVEGDDLIGYYVKNRDDNEKVVVVSADRDLTQLISDDVIVFNPRNNDFITSKNSVKELGITHENIVLEKMICGDVSDNIKGIKGVGQPTLVKLFPEIVENKTDLEAIMRRSRELLEERKEKKQKPLKSLENILNGVTDGCQGNKIYEINRKIIDLSEPLLTKEAEKELNDIMHAPIDTSDRDVKNAYRIIDKNRMFDLTDETKFGDVLAPYSRIIMMERKRYENYKRDNK